MIFFCVAIIFDDICQRTSNWEAPVLTEAQIRYAATDAWGALKMYQRLAAFAEEEALGIVK